MNIIEEIDVFQLTDGLPHVIVRIRDDSGETGFGECWWGIPTPSDPYRGGAPIVATVKNLIKPSYLGKDSKQVQSLWYETWDHLYRYGDGGIITMALSGVDMALWDLNARRLETSVLDLLGGSAHQSIPAYASFPPLRSEERVTTETRRAIEHGYTAIKLHELETNLVEAARIAGGDELLIMVDVNGHFDVEEAIDFGRKIEQYKVTWYEEPVRPMRNLDLIERVADQVPMAIAAGENEYSLHDFERMIASTGIRFLQPEITKVGGITQAVKIGHLAEKSGTPLCPHNFRGGLPLYASLHWGFSSPATKWFELPWLPEGVEFASKIPNTKIVDGSVTPPQGPGLGVQPVLSQAEGAKPVTPLV